MLKWLSLRQFNTSYLNLRQDFLQLIFKNASIISQAYLLIPSINVMKFQNLPIGTRLASGFALVMLLATFAAGIGLWRLHTVADKTREMMQDPLQNERMTEEWFRLTYAGLRRTIAIVKSTDDSLADFFAEETRHATERNGEILKFMEQRADTAEEKALLEKIASARKAYVNGRDQVIKAKKEGRLDEMQALFDKFIPSSKLYQDSLQEFLKMQQQEIDRLSQEIAVLAESSQKLIGVLIACFIAFGASFSFVLTRGIVGSLQVAVEHAEHIAAGDLSQTITVRSKDETGQLLMALQTMSESLRGIVAEVRVSTDSIVTAAQEISAGNFDLSARTESQASSLEETASSMEELTSAVQNNSQHANQANQLAQVASQAASDGGAVVGKVVHTMDSIHASSQKIVDIISVIDGIAFQTNILALNAAVEAARAGEQGRGFAVVAAEVRSLAQRSANAAKEIKTLIDDSVEKVAQGGQLVSQAGASMQDIVKRVDSVSHIIHEISLASGEQASGIAQVNDAISHMDSATQQNAALVEEAAAAAQSLQDQAQRLQQAVSVFKLAPQAAYHAASPRLAPARLR